MNPAWKRIAVACFLVVLVDGFDTTSIAFVAPALIASWGISPASLTPAFVLTSAGAVVGYLACGRLVARWGGRALIIASVIWFGLFSFCSAFVADVMTLAALRFVTAFGLGAAVPTALALAANQAAPARQMAVTIVVATGLPLGSGIGALLGAALISTFGWRSVFVAGGLIPLFLAVWLYFALPPLPRIAVAGSVAAAKASELFRKGTAATTLLIWMFAFLVFVTTYALIFWIPTLLAVSGFPRTQATLGGAAFGVGGVLGNLALLPWVGRFRVHYLLMAAAAVAGISLLGFAVAAPTPAITLAWIGGIGAGLTAGCAGQAALSVLAYPPALRTTGIGWTAAVGRVGSIAGPAIGGAFLAAQWEIPTMVASAIVPCAAGVIVLLFLQRRIPA